MPPQTIRVMPMQMQMSSSEEKHIKNQVVDEKSFPSLCQ